MKNNTKTASEQRCFNNGFRTTMFRWHCIVLSDCENCGNFQFLGKWNGESDDLKRWNAHRIDLTRLGIYALLFGLVPISKLIERFWGSNKTPHHRPKLIRFQWLSEIETAVEIMRKIARIRWFFDDVRTDLIILRQF